MSIGPKLNVGWFDVNVHATTIPKILTRNRIDEVSDELTEMRREAIAAVRTEAINNLLDEISETAVEDYMHKDNSIKDDILAIRTGKLSHAVKNKSDPNHIQKVYPSKGKGIVGVENDSRIPYASVHEGGAHITANDGFMHYRWHGEWHMSAEVNVPARPYLHPAKDQVLEEKGENAIDKEIMKILADKAYIQYGGTF